MQTSIILIYVFAAIGLIDTIYLSSHVRSKKPVKCVFFPEEWCHKVQYSKYSRTFGIPNPYAGLGMYVLILAMLSLYVAGSWPFWPVATVISIGFLFSLYFTAIQAFVLRAFCTWCVVSAINFVVMFIAIII